MFLCSNYSKLHTIMYRDKLRNLDKKKTNKNHEQKNLKFNSGDVDIHHARETFRSQYHPLERQVIYKTVKGLPDSDETLQRGFSKECCNEFFD